MRVVGHNVLFDYMSKHIQLTDEDQHIIQQRTTIRALKKGEFVVKQGDICRYESFVVSGCVKTFYVDDDGDEHIVMFGVENWWAADLGSFISEMPAYYNVQCIEDTSLIQFTKQNLEVLYKQLPKLERFFRIIIQNAYVASERRIVRNFSLTAKERYIGFREQYPSLEQRIPQYMIASYLGITKEFLSKIRSQLASGLDQ